MLENNDEDVKSKNEQTIEDAILMGLSGHSLEKVETFPSGNRGRVCRRCNLIEYTKIVDKRVAAQNIAYALTLQESGGQCPRTRNTPR